VLVDPLNQGVELAWVELKLVLGAMPYETLGQPPDVLLRFLYCCECLE